MDLISIWSCADAVFFKLYAHIYIYITRRAAYHGYSPIGELIHNMGLPSSSGGILCGWGNYSPGGETSNEPRKKPVLLSIILVGL